MRSPLLEANNQKSSRQCHNQQNFLLWLFLLIIFLRHYYTGNLEVQIGTDKNPGEDRNSEATDSGPYVNLKSSTIQASSSAAFLANSPSQAPSLAPSLAVMRPPPDFNLMPPPSIRNLFGSTENVAAAASNSPGFSESHFYDARSPGGVSSPSSHSASESFPLVPSSDEAGPSSLQQSDSPHLPSVHSPEHDALQALMLLGSFDNSNQVHQQEEQPENTTPHEKALKPPKSPTSIWKNLRIPVPHKEPHEEMANAQMLNHAMTEVLKYTKPFENESLSNFAVRVIAEIRVYLKRYNLMSYVRLHERRWFQNAIQEFYIRHIGRDPAGSSKSKGEGSSPKK